MRITAYRFKLRTAKEANASSRGRNDIADPPQCRGGVIWGYRHRGDGRTDGGIASSQAGRIVTIDEAVAVVIDVVVTVFWLACTRRLVKARRGESEVVAQSGLTCARRRLRQVQQRVLAAERLERRRRHKQAHRLTCPRGQVSQ